MLVGAGMGLWIAGFDIIYACQDYEHDRSDGVYSVPARFGIAAALRISAAVHVVSIALFIWFGIAVDLGLFWYAGVALAAVALVYEHLIVHPTDLSRVNRAFFTVNGFIGIALFVTAVADLVRQGLRA